LEELNVKVYESHVSELKGTFYVRDIFITNPAAFVKLAPSSFVKDLRSPPK